MSYVFPNARALAWTGAIDLAGDTIKVLLVEVGSSVAAEDDAIVLSDFTTLLETTATGYSRETLTGKAVVDPGGGPVTFEADDVDFGILGAGSSGDIAGALLFVDNGGAGSDVPLCYFDSVTASSIAFPYTPAGHTFLIEWVGGVVAEL